MIKTVHYGPYKFTPTNAKNGYIDGLDRSAKSRSKEPHTVWQSIKSDTSELDLYVCPHCFLYTTVESDLLGHKCRLASKKPGTKLYDSPEYMIYEVQGTDPSSNLYVQSLSLFGRLFLETKSVSFALDNFLLYVLHDKKSGLCAGFFSKEKSSWYEYNLACIIVFPAFQKRNLGNLLIGFSYFLSRAESKTGSPEKPLSIHGQRSYLSYWCGELCYLFLSSSRIGSLRTMSRQTGIDADDIISALQHMKAISKKDGRTQVDVSKILSYYNSHKVRRAFDEKWVCVSERNERPQTRKPRRYTMGASTATSQAPDSLLNTVTPTGKSTAVPAIVPDTPVKPAPLNAIKEESEAEAHGSEKSAGKLNGNA